MATQPVGTRSAKGRFSASGNGNDGKPPNQYKGEHNDQGHYAEDLLPDEALINTLIDTVASILRAKSLDFDVLNKMKQVASQFDRQSGDRIVLLSDYIVTIRNRSPGTTRKNEKMNADEHSEDNPNPNGTESEGFSNYSGDDDEYA